LSDISNERRRYANAGTNVVGKFNLLYCKV
jgi:hypothetical protein